MMRRYGTVMVLSLCLGACDGDSGDDAESPDGGSAGSTAGGSGAAAGGTSQGGSAGATTGGSATGGSSRCDGGTGTFTPAAIDVHQEYCAARTAHVASCGTPDDGTTCPEISCVERVYESEGFIAYAECQMRKDCMAFLSSDDDCLESAGGPLTPEVEAFASFCEAKLEECAPDLSDDLCVVALPVIHRSIFCAVDACLQGPCATMSSCLEQASAAIPDCW